MSVEDVVGRLRYAVLGCALTAAACGAPGPAPGGGVGASSPMFRAEPTHTGVSDQPGPRSFPAVQWAFQTRGPIRSSPALVDGVLYFGSTDGSAYAIAAADGSLLWSAEVGPPVTSSPAVVGDRVIFTDRTNVVHALRRGDGRPAWRIEAGPDLPLPWGHEGWDYYTSSGVVTTLGEGGAGRPVVVVGSGSGSLLALEPGDGAVVWRRELGSRIRGTAAVADDVVYIGASDGVVHALSLADGSERWTFETEGRRMDAADFGFDRRQIISSPAVRDGTVYVGSRDGSMYALDARSGALRWRADAGSPWVMASPAVTADRLVEARSSGGTVFGRDPATGEEIWSVTTGAFAYPSPVISGDVVYFGNGAAWLHAADVADGAEVWRYRMPAAIYATPVLDGDRMYLGLDDGRLYAIGAGRGPAPRTAVYWDDTLMRRSAWGGSDAHRPLVDFLTARGYELLDGAGLSAFLRDRVTDGAPSVVVFGMDGLPEGIASDPDDTPLLRRYLDAGGKAVWVGFPPLMIGRDDEGNFVGIDRARAGAVLGVDLTPWDTDVYGTWPTEDGVRWGIRDWYSGGPSATPGSVDVVLAADELGRASAWVKSYGGPAGSGFVMWPGSVRHERLQELRRVAEHGLFGEPRVIVP